MAASADAIEADEDDAGQPRRGGACAALASCFPAATVSAGVGISVGAAPPSAAATAAAAAAAAAAAGRRRGACVQRQ